MFGKFREKIVNYNKFIFFLIFIVFSLHTIFYDFNNVKILFQQPEKALKDLKEIKTIILTLFFSLFGKIIIFCLLFCIYFNLKNHFRIKRLKNRLSLWSKLSYYVHQIGEDVFNELPIGIIVIDSVSKEIQWVNNYANIIFNNPDINTLLYDLNFQMSDLLNSDEKQIVLTIGKESFDCIYNEEFNVFYLFNVTEREKIKKLYYQKTPALIFLSFDNLDNSLRNCDLSEQSQIKVEYLSALSDFFEIYESYLKQLSEDKFLLLSNRQQLEKMMENKFSILKSIRDISNKYKLKITLSMGIACYNLPYNKLAFHSQNAIELAQKRGGDQVVVNIENQKIQYFGATISSLSTNSKVSTRVNSEIIKDLLEKHDNCFIMGHIRPDLDSLGSMIAFYKIASSIKNNSKHYLIIDEEKIDQNFKFIYKNLIQEEKKLSKKIINTNKALKLVNNNSLLVVLDTYNKDIVNSPELLNLTPNVLIIDHHRTTEAVIPNTFSYLDSSASSTVEILIELIVFFNSKIEITPYEASIMYGGMIIDTNYFTYRTSSRTLEAAAQLISMGAESFKVKFWLRQEFSKIIKMNELISNMEIYLDRYAIAKSDDICNNRSFLAQVSENILNIQNIDAAFTISKLQENKIGISARSYNQINVQLIMEQMGGGGHINSAAAQIDSNNIDEIIEKLKNILFLNYKEGLKNMKVILLEDLKNKSKKNEIIEVNSGYGNFLIKEKKAILANEKNIQNLEKEKKIQEEQSIKHNILMQQIKNDIDNKQIDIFVNVGPQGKIYGKITSKNIVDEFYKQHNIAINKKKIFLENEINSLGQFKVNVHLTSDICASFFINVKSVKNN
ncbi:50S ribosomal protein L9 [Candidatus Phytoplasma palmae]|uniref:50S ribosomal protein L9 n=1 Tax=Candidatus Phytoplasma palmae TaxID=85624 RepID=UPI0039905D2B